MALFRVIATSSFVLLAILALCVEARRPITFHKSEAVQAAITKHAAVNATDMTPQLINVGAPCRARDISIQQGEISGVGIPTWQVQIMNQCTNPLCGILQVIVQCGQFHSASFVNPKVFRRLDVKAGTCIVNDGNRVPNAEAVTFQYREIVKEPLTLKSAKVVCW